MEKELFRVVYYNKERDDFREVCFYSKNYKEAKTYAELAYKSNEKIAYFGKNCPLK